MSSERDKTCWIRTSGFWRVATAHGGRCGWDGTGVEDGVDGLGAHETHEQQGLEDGVGELRGLVEQLGGAGRVCGGELLHGGEDVEELGGRERVEGSGDGVGAGHAGGQLATWWEGRQGAAGG
ncbi:hypothetical protein VP1G_10623 [Cytospora mali]|uniref:Uncharacterized protein n=1 Tax=Cytospora mali TaxID=578113 RepID=A0A194UQT9_CYTMA|nr:hypothetical protein VP1G_10623 [Valsa mali var. pyri (nom. inval.)]